MPEEGAGTSIITILLTEPNGGVHKYSGQQVLYQCLHDFLGKSTWKMVASNTTEGGMTWLELFILFDTGGWRDKEAIFHLDAASKIRAEKCAMNGRAKMMRSGRTGQVSRQTANCTTRASLGAEIANFKAIIRYIITTNADQANQCMFTVDDRSHIRRLKPFAIIGHQPGFNSCRITTEVERRKVEMAILKQRVGTTSKQALVTMRSVHARRDEGEICRSKLKRAKIGRV